MNRQPPIVWGAWYSEGGPIVGSSFEEWKALPSDGLQWVSWVLESGITHFNAADWYWWNDNWIDRILSKKEWGVHVPHPGGCKSCVKKGTGVSDERFSEIAREAKEWGFKVWEELRDVN